MRQNSIQFDNIFVECHHISAVMVFYFNLFFFSSRKFGNSCQSIFSKAYDIHFNWFALIIVDFWSLCVRYRWFFIRMHVNDDFIMHQKRQQTEILCVSAHINWRERERKKNFLQFRGFHHTQNNISINHLTRLKIHLLDW